VGRLTGSLEPGEALEGVVLIVARAEQITGRVLGPALEPLADVKVEALPSWTPADEDPAACAGKTRLGPPGATTTTGSDGAFVLTDLTPHPYFLRTVAPGFGPWKKVHSPADGSLEIVLSGYGVSDLTGRVVDADGNGIAGADVRLRYAVRKQTTTDADGSFLFPELGPDRPIAVVVSAAGYAVQAVQPVEIQPDGPNEVTVQLEPERVIAGRVVDEEGNEVADALVKIEGDRILGVGEGLTPSVRRWEYVAERDGNRTDTTGAFRLDRLYDGFFLVTATHPENPLRKAFATVASGTEDVVLTLDPSAVWDVRLVGRVTDALTGAPVPSFEIHAASSDRGWKRVHPRKVEDENGVYELPGLTPARIMLWFTASGYAQKTLSHQRYDAGEHRLDLELYPARDLTLRLVDRGGRPIGGATLWVHGPGDERPMFASEGAPPHSGLNFHAKLDTRGEARLHGLPAGLLTLVFGGRTGLERQEFLLDLTVPLDGMQELVVDADVPRRLQLFLYSADPETPDGPVVELIDYNCWGDLREGRDDVHPLAAPRFTLEVRDSEGAVRTTASGTRQEGDRWTITETWDETSRTVDRSGSPVLLLLVPDGALDFDVRAPGHRPFHVHLTPEELTPTRRTTLGWALLLERDA